MYELPKILFDLGLQQGRRQLAMTAAVASGTAAPCWPWLLIIGGILALVVLVTREASKKTT